MDAEADIRAANGLKGARQNEERKPLGGQPCGC